MDIFGNLRKNLKAKGIVQRERTPLELVIYGVYLYVIGLSFRDVSRAIAMVEEYVSHVAVWEWFQKFGKEFGEKVFLKNMPDIIVVVADETEVKIGDRQVYLWAAICPETWKIAYLMLSYDRSNFTTYLFFRRLIALHGKKPKLVITDGGPWYYWPLKRLGIRHEVMSGDVRSYIESFLAILKDRTRIFDHYFPCNCEQIPKHVYNWLYLFAFYHNACFRTERGCEFEIFLESMNEVVIMLT
jgi:transposase-like protein